MKFNVVGSLIAVVAALVAQGAYAQATAPKGGTDVKAGEAGQTVKADAKSDKTRDQRKAELVGLPGELHDSPRMLVGNADVADFSLLDEFAECFELFADRRAVALIGRPPGDRFRCHPRSRGPAPAP